MVLMRHKKMDVIVIEDEEETNSDIVIVDDDEEIQEVEASPLDEVETVGVNFEMVLLPEQYEADIMETAFFDYNSYNVKYEKQYGIVAQDSEFGIISEPFTALDVDNQYVNNGTDYERMIDEGNSKQFTSFEPSVYSNPEYNIFIHANDTEGQDYNFQYKDRSMIGETRLTKIYNDSPSSSVDKENSSGKTYKFKTRRRLASKSKKDTTDSDPKFKCPVCKRPRTFYTLEAVNNHLKFEHISLIKQADDSR